ncbi:MAG: hypothetical protein ACREEB_08025 [Caulobacteraceae bacterium]
MSGPFRFLLPTALLLATSTSALASGPPVAQPAPTATTTASAAVKFNPEDKVVCKYEVPSGSRLGGHRVCMKKSDWEAQALAARNARDFAPPSPH